MDKSDERLEKRLRDDAAEIRAQVSPQLEARIRYALRVSRPVPQARSEFSWPLWLAASLSGAAVATVAVVAVSLSRTDGRPNEAPEPVAYSVPEYARELERQFPLNVENADLTAPLDDELEKLRADLERARQSVEQDLKFTF